MATLQETLDLVTAESTTVDSAIALINGLRQQVADFLSGASVSPTVQAGVDAIFAAATAQKGKLDDALAANVPPPTP